MKAVEQLLPSWGASASRAFREGELFGIGFGDGVTDKAGRHKKDIHDQYIKPDNIDTLFRLFGFNPVDVSSKSDRVWNEKKVREKYSEMRREITSDYRDLINDGNPTDSEIADIALRIEEYNAKALRSKRNIPLIDDTTLKNALADKDNKFFKADLSEKEKKSRDKKAKKKLVIRNGRIVRE
jgi:hypothetical protein